MVRSLAKGKATLTVCFSVLGATLLSAPQSPPPVGEQWSISYRNTGVTVSQNGTVPFNRQSPAWGIADVGGPSKSVSISGTLRVTITYSGPPLAYSDFRYVKIQSNTTATAAGATVQVAANDELGKSTVSEGQGSKSMAMSGVALKKIVLDSSNKMEFDLKYYASASATGSTLRVGASGGYTISIGNRGLAVTETSPPTTYRRPQGGGIPEANVPDPATGMLQVDIGAQIEWVKPWFSSGYWQMKWNWGLFGTSLGNGWMYPLTDIGWTNLYLKNQSQNLDTGTVIAEFEKEEQNSDHGPLYNKYYSSPWSNFITLTATDSKGSMDMITKVVFHGPLEETGESWKADYEGDLSACPEVAQNYQHFTLGAVQNDTNVPLNVSINVERSVTKTFGLQKTENLGLDVHLIEALQLKFGAEYTYDSETVYALRSSLTTNGVLQPGYGREAFLIFNGSVEFPLVSKWNNQGYAGDYQLEVASYGHVVLSFRDYKAEE